MGFHLRAGSVDRLITYLEGKQLSEAQMAALVAEKEPGATREELLAGMDAAFHRAELVVRGIDPARPCHDDIAEPKTNFRRLRSGLNIIHDDSLSTGLLAAVAAHGLEQPASILLSESSPPPKPGINPDLQQTAGAC